MKRTASLVINITLFIQLLLLFLLFFADRIELPAWLQVAGRLHPMVLHLPIGFLFFLFVLIVIRKTFRRKQFQKTLLVSLMLTALSTSVTALFGFFLSVQGDYDLDALYWHRLSGAILSFIAFFLLVWYQNVKKGEVVFYMSMAVAMVALVVTGHTGSVLTHGKNFILAPITEVSAKKLSIETSTLYEIAVSPILEKKCFSCHNERKAKGKLIMTSIEKFKLGGENGVPWVAGNPDSSRMIHYIHLPLSDDNHMPPDGKPQLTVDEIFILESWIQSGADFDKRVAEYSETDTLRKWSTAKMNTLNVSSIENGLFFFLSIARSN
jgi:uncharacterized membrane protein